MKYKELPANLFKLINLIEQEDIKRCYRKDIAKKLNISESIVGKQLTELAKRGYIKKEQEGGGQGKTKDGSQRKLIIKILK